MENSDKFSDINDKLIELELAKRGNKGSAVVKFLPAIAIAASFTYSHLLCLGLIVGYFASKIFSKYVLEQGKVDCIYIDCGKWKLHMHHWILGALILLFVWFVDRIYLPAFLVGVICGIMAHDIYDFNDWHKVLVKNEEVAK